MEKKTKLAWLTFENLDRVFSRRFQFHPTVLALFRYPNRQHLCSETKKQTREQGVAQDVNHRPGNEHHHFMASGSVILPPMLWFIAQHLQYVCKPSSHHHSFQMCPLLVFCDLLSTNHHHELRTPDKLM